MSSPKTFEDFIFGISCVVGRKRKVNQDNADVFLPADGTLLPPLMVLADGMGGYQGGEMASHLVLEAFADVYRQSRGEVDYEKILIQCVNMSHQRVKQKANENSRLAGMGSTVVAAFIGADKLHIVNVGDSRAYLLKDGKALQISRDQTVVADQMRAGTLTPEQAFNHPKKNVLSMAINAKRPSVTPILSFVEFSSNDILVLCSDGLWGMMTPSMLESMLWAAGNEFEPQEAVEKLTYLANQRGGADNISVIIARHRDRLKVKALSEDITNDGA
jgi:protein phosphatase